MKLKLLVCISVILFMLCSCSRKSIIVLDNVDYIEVSTQQTEGDIIKIDDSTKITEVVEAINNID